MIRGLDPASTVLRDGYDNLVAEYGSMTFDYLPGGLAGFYDEFTLETPEEVISAL